MGLILKPQAAVPPLSVMADLLFGSICIEDAFGPHISQSQDGRKWIPVDALQSGPFQVGKNGKHYLGVSVWVNDELDTYGNSASISLSQTKEEREAKAKRIYIGNLKRNTPNGTAASPGVAQGYPSQPQYGVPQQPYAPGGAYPTAAPQGNPYAPQGNTYAPAAGVNPYAHGSSTGTAASTAAWDPKGPNPF